jgi:predicted site-specific integrase-resolvase
MSYKKYKVEIEIDFDKRPSKKVVLNSLFDMLRDNKVQYKLYKYNNRLYHFFNRSIKNDKYK